jgi:transposase
MKTRRDEFKRARIADLLRKGVSTEAIVERVCCSKQFISEIRQELKAQQKVG